ncbi:hypothetical protein H4S06_005283, partial [Coemansia sp. BCRC 34490]
TLTTWAQTPVSTSPFSTTWKPPPQTAATALRPTQKPSHTFAHTWASLTRPGTTHRPPLTTSSASPRALGVAWTRWSGNWTTLPAFLSTPA